MINPPGAESSRLALVQTQLSWPPVGAFPLPSRPPLPTIASNIALHGALKTNLLPQNLATLASLTTKLRPLTPFSTMSILTFGIYTLILGSPPLPGRQSQM